MEIKEKQLQYLDLILEKNKSINLTAIKNRDEAIIKHLKDSLFITSLSEYIKADTVIDIGTGAGFPGAILAIESPKKQFTLVDSTNKKLKVINEISEELGVKNIKTVHARAEELAKKTEYKEKYDLCVSRAVASMRKLLVWTMPFVKKGGYFIAYKGEDYTNELKDIHKELKKYNARVEKIHKINNDKEIELVSENSKNKENNLMRENILQNQDISGHVLIVIKRL